jgi:transposase
MNKNRNQLEEQYKKESDPMVKERLLLVLRIEYDNMTPTRAGREIDRSRSWASKSKWWRRYIQEGLNGLNDKSRSGGRHTKLPEEIAFLIQNELLLESKQGWSTKQVNDIIIVRKGEVRYHYIIISLYHYIIISLYHYIIISLYTYLQITS